MLPTHWSICWVAGHRPSNTCTLHCWCSPQCHGAEKSVQCSPHPPTSFCLKKAASNKNKDPYLTETAARPQNEQSTDVGKNPDLNEARTLYEQLMAGEMFDKVFDAHSDSTHDVVDAGEKALVIIYNGESIDTLDSLQLSAFLLKGGFKVISC